MREILFRGKNKLGVWVYGIPILSSINTEKEKVIIVDEYADNLNVEMCVTMDTIGQFTGLTDKNGVKIFEGDIVEYFLWGLERRTYAGGVVVWSNSSFCISDDNNLTEPAFLSDCVVLEVIGNVHDNSLLLKGGEE